MQFPDIKPALTWLKSCYSESDGNGSSTRVHTGLIIAFTLGVGLSFAVSTHHKLMTPEQFNGYLGSAGTFVTVTCGVLYGVNRAGGWADSKAKQDKDGQ